MSALLGAGGSGGSGRTALPATTFFVRTDGVNTPGNGLTDTAAGAYRTFQFAWNDIVGSYDFKDQTVTIKAGNEAGTKTFAGIAYTGWVGGGSVIISGNGGTRTTFVDQTTFAVYGAFCSVNPLPGSITYQNATIGATVAGDGIDMVAPSVTILGSGMIFAAQGGAHVLLQGGATVIIAGPYTLDTGTSIAHIDVGAGASVSDNGAASITYNGGVTLSRGFLWMVGGAASINAQSTFTFSGSFTGPDTKIEAGGSIRYGFGSPLVFFGGSQNPIILDGVLQIGTTVSYDLRGQTFFGDGGGNFGLYGTGGGFDWVGWNGAGIGWVSGGLVAPYALQSLETGTHREANGQIGQYNSTNPQKRTVYGTRTNASNYERLSLDAEFTTANTHRIMSEALGTGTVRIIAIDGFTKAGAAVAADIPQGTWALIHDSSGATTKLCYNDAGTLRTVALT